MNNKSNLPWIGVDLDGTLANYSGFVSPSHIGEPIKPMVDRVKNWLSKGIKVKIFTARACEKSHIPYVEEWVIKHIGQPLEVTNVKDYHMLQLWDDRAVSVAFNLGEPCFPQTLEESRVPSAQKNINSSQNKKIILTNN